MERPGYESDRFRIRLARLAGSRLEDERDLTADWDRSVSGLAFSADGDTLFATAADLGQRSLFAVDVADGSVTRLHAEGSVAGLAVSDDRLVTLHNDLAAPSQMFVSDLAGGNRRALTSFNADRQAAARVGDYEQFTFAGWNDETVHGYLVRPVDFDPDRRYPVAFLIHGGPQGSFGNSFHYRWNPPGVRGRRFRRGDDRLPWFGRLRTGLHRFDPRGLGRQAARGPAEGSGRRARPLPVPRRRSRVRSGRFVRRLHGETGSRAPGRIGSAAW